MSNDELYYRLDRNDRIVEVGGVWDRFAKDNDGPELISRRIEGQSLFAHVVGKPTRDFVWTVLDAVRKLKRPKTHLYRCDSHGLKRRMEMTIEPERAGGLCLRHRLISTEPIAKPLLFKPAVSGTGRGQLTFRCSSCNRLKVNGAWLEPEQAIEVEKGQPYLDHGVMRVAYSVCGNCLSVANRPPVDGARR